MEIHLKLALISCIFASASVICNEVKIVCYYGSWAVYRPGLGKFDVENIDPFKCTHLIYTFTGLSSDGTVRILDQWNDIDLGALKRFSALKSENPALKTSIAIGGWNEGSEIYSQVAADENLRQTMAQSALNLMQTYGFDGFDLDWEYPAQRGGRPEDKKNALLLLKTLRETFDATGVSYLLSAAVGATESAIDQSYELPAFAEHLDFVNLMAYDFHGPFDKKTGHNAPLHPSSKETNKTLNVRAAVNAWLSHGVPAKKIVLGMPTYGHSFTLLEDSHEVGAEASAGTPGPFTREAGMLGYNEICEMISDNSWTVKWDEEQMVPYTYKDNQWVSFDDRESLKLKVDFAKEKSLGGVMIWSIETDDFQGTCGEKYPLLSLINHVLGIAQPSDPTQSTTTGSSNTNPTTLPTTTTTSKPNGDELCETEGWVRDPKDCAIFYLCLKTSNGLDPVRFTCSNGLFFNLKILACDYPYNVPECL